MTDRIRIKKFYPNYFSFLCQGSMVLVIGAILPYLIEEANLSYTVAGTLLSAFAIGNFLASFVFPALEKFAGRKPAILLTATVIPLALFAVTLIPPVWAMIVLFTILGICRGSNSIINNAYINENSDGSAFALNILHMTFAIGAFSAPLFASIFFNNGFSWKAIVYAIAIASAVAVVLLTQLDLKEKNASEADLQSADKAENSTGKIDLPGKKCKFYKMPVFWISGIILFFYLGFENCINGWFVTYFRSTGIMSDTYANELVSFTWLAVLFGRLFTALVSTKIKKQTIILADCLATTVFFILLVSTKNLALITLCIVGLGFFLAGIYATSISNAHAAIAGSDIGTSMLLAIAAFGGIVAPQIVGSVADKIGLVGSIGILTVNVTAMIVFSIVNKIMHKD